MDAIALLHPSQTLKKPVLLSDPLLALSSLLQSMAESFAFDLANKVLGKIASLALQEVALAWGVTADLDGLKDTLSVIQAVISDAEEQQSNSRQIADWLRKLKKALYEAEDVLDDFEYEALRRKVAKAGSITKQVHSFFSTSNPLPFSFKMGRKMKNLKERLDKIAADRSKFNLTERAVVVDTTHVVHRKREMTHSYVDVSNIIGREQDKENIVSILMKSSSDEQENVSVIPIIGIGGMGKTALAKLVYNDGRVVKHFDKRMWVCVSDEDNEIETLTKKILISATMGGTGTLSMDQFQNLRFSLAEFSMDELQTQLRNALDDKRYLLVLDDVWNSDREKWLKLKELLMGSAGGSKIVVTTRKKSVASVLGTFPAQELKGLPDEDCQSLFLKCAFKDGQGKQYPNLVKIGNQIVKKCGGVPLAVRSLGGLLYSKLEERDWELVRDNEIWTLEEKDDGILPALKLSYDELPSHLKPSFFQDVEDYKVSVFFKMHDLVHDLALSIKKIESKEVEDASITDNVPEQILALLQEKNNIRTIWFPYSEINATAEYVGTCSSRFKYMRVLDLRGTDFEELPSSIGNMKHLRYLDICGNKRVKKLPASICKLYLLLTLSFKECTELENCQEIWNVTMWNLCLKDCKTSLLLEAWRLEGVQVWCLCHQDGDEENDIQGISCRLRSLMVVDLPKLEALPGWLIQGLAASTLHYLLIRRCHKFKALPESLENLTSLQELRIDDCPQLSTLSGGMHRLTTLKVLSIRDCPELSKRCKPEIGEDWHKIAHVPEIYIDGEAIKSTTNN
ncbi:putative disease resistance protein RGA1 [Vitis vinifera]|uniref:Putative disease resistance protein RGA1 n=1 Tax=Vitis vinifera TaxID=29760 RepID=A0A438JKR2_VITVI|nr:putative disease resistance protein RGA1 [Vitis vinifera]